jgi:hypothetical protein
MTAQEKLRAAATLISEATATLDTTQERCTKCSMTHYQNFEDWKRFEVLNPLPAKLRRIAESLERQQQRAETRQGE